MKTTNSFEDTICAIATVIGTGGVSIIRLSGTKAVEIVSKIFFKNKNLDKAEFKPNYIHHGFIFNNDKLVDEVVVLYFKNPNSYTGEDVVEIQCHGGVSVTNAIFELCLNSGARIAQRGEFTQRAFLNGKMDLSQAESVLDLISAKTKKSVELSASNLCGKLGQTIQAIRQEVIDLLSHIVAAIDFPEEVEEPNYENLAEELQNLTDKIDNILKGASASNFLRNGAKIAVAGKPNVGKSSLFNNILNYERAIVSDLAGTTRDVLTENIDINGIPVVLTDTAGIRNTDKDKIEAIGIEYAKRSVDESDLVLFLVDLSNPLEQEDFEIYELVKNKQHLVVGTKTDLEKQVSDFKVDVEISNLTQNGVNELIKKIENILKDKTLNEDSDFLTNSRQQECLRSCKESLKKAKESALMKIEQDFIAIDIKSALIYLGEITGDDVTEELLDNIFDKFCIGK